MDLSVIIPTFRPSEGTVEFISALHRYLNSWNGDCEIVVVDDGSPREMVDKFRENLSDRNLSGVVLISLSRNVGQQRALLCGIGESNGELIATMDDDSQNDPEDIVRMVDHLRKNDLDVVIGAYERKRHGFFRGICTRVVRFFSHRMVGVPKSVQLTSFRLFRRETGQKILELNFPTPVIGFLLCAVTHKIENLTVKHLDGHRESGYSLKSLAKYFSDMIIEYSDLPLRVLAVCGFLIFVASGVSGVGFLIAKLSGATTVSGFTTVVVLLCFIGGSSLMALSIVGVYVRRIFLSSVRGAGTNVLATREVLWKK